MAINGDQATVRGRPLAWDGHRLALGEPRPEIAALSLGGIGFNEPLLPGDGVSLHWSWVCDRLDERQLCFLRDYSARQLRVTNQELAHPGPAMILD